MNFRKIEINDLKIVAPLKCGTRWLLERAEKSSFIDIEDLKEETDSETIFLYREPKDHLLSALQTDFIIQECDLNKTLDQLLNNKSPHWRGDMYEYIHRAWCYNKFKIVNYLNISELIDDYVFDKNIYDFSVHPPYFLTKQMVLDLVPNDIKKELFKMVDNNDYWLKQILENNDKVLSKNIIDISDNIMLENEKINKKIISNYESIITKNKLLIKEKNFIINQNNLIIDNYRKNKGKLSLI
jgi:hypothetical protein